MACSLSVKTPRRLREEEKAMEREKDSLRLIVEKARGRRMRREVAKKIRGLDAKLGCDRIPHSLCVHTFRGTAGTVGVKAGA